MHRVINWCQQFLLNIPRNASPDTQPNGRQRALLTLPYRCHITPMYQTIRTMTSDCCVNTQSKLTNKTHLYGK